MKTYLPALVLCFIFLKSNAQIFHENFEAPSFGDSVISNSSNVSNSGWNLCSRLQVTGSYCDSAYIGLGDTVTLTTASFSTVGYPAVILSFSHICKISFFDKAILEVSADGGLTWTLICTNVTYLGFAPWLFQSCIFSSASYGNWYPGSYDTIPENNWWHQETFDLTGLLSNTPNAQIRFTTYDEFADLTDTLNGWKIDDIEVDSMFYSAASFSVSSSVDSCAAPQDISFTIGGFAIGYPSTDSVNAHIYFGDGMDSLFNIPIVSGSFGAIITHTFNLPGAYSSQVILTSPDGITDTLSRYNLFTMGSNICGNVIGKVYIDFNNNCLFDSTDEAVKYRRVKLIDSTQSVVDGYTNYLGDYTFYIPANPYTIEIDSAIMYGNGLSILCPASGFYSVTAVPSSGNDFALGCNPGFDLYSVAYINQLRPNMQRCFYPQYGEMGCQLMNGQAILILDSLVTFDGAVPSPSSINGDTLTWNFTNLSYSDNFSPEVCVTPDASLNIGDTVWFTTMIEPVSGDLNPMNNTFQEWAIISNSCDPNQKLVDPDGNISLSTELNYTIEFQNTGNDLAYNIYVLDTLNPDLDVNTLRINGSSHIMTIDFLAGNILKFNFINIMLPDSGADEPASHGFITYSIKPNSNLANGTVIHNTAAIYFDFNLPVITNTTSNVIDSALTTAVPLNEGWQSEDIKVYPNPVSDHLKIYLSEKLIAKSPVKISIYNLFGEKIFEQRDLPASTTINLKKIAGGIYFYEITAGTEIIRKDKLIKM